MTEAKWSKEFSRVLRSQGAMVYPLVASQYVERGWPDLLVVHRRWSGLVERKGLKTRTENHQIGIMAGLADRYYPCLVARLVDESSRSLAVGSYDQTGTYHELFTCNYHNFLERAHEYK